MAMESESVQKLINLLTTQQKLELQNHLSQVINNPENRVTVAMEKKQRVAPEGEPPLKQHQSEEAEQENPPVQQEKEDHQAFERSSTNPFGQTNSLFGSSSTSFGGSSDYGQQIQASFKSAFPTSLQKLLATVHGATDPTDMHEKLEAVGFFSAFYENWKQSFQTNPSQGATQPSQLAQGFESAPAFGATSTRAAFGAPRAFGPITPYSIASSQIITEEAERFESWFAIDGADYCVIAADFTGDHTNISRLSGECVMASCGGFQDDAKALQKYLFAENLIYEGKHKKPMSYLEMRRLFYHFKQSHPIRGSILLGGLDSEGKGRLFTPLGRVVYSLVSGSRQTVPPILKYKLPANDVVARMSETEAVDLAKIVFASATNTGDKLQIVVLNASGIRTQYVDPKTGNKLEFVVPNASGIHTEYVDPKTGDKLEFVVPNASGQVLSRKRKRSSSV